MRMLHISAKELSVIDCLIHIRNSLSVETKAMDLSDENYLNTYYLPLAHKRNNRSLCMDNHAKTPTGKS